MITGGNSDPGSAGASPALFGAPPKSSVDDRSPQEPATSSKVSRGARDTTGEAPALPGACFRALGAGKSSLLHDLGMHDHACSGEYFLEENAGAVLSASVSLACWLPDIDPITALHAEKEITTPNTDICIHDTHH